MVLTVGNKVTVKQIFRFHRSIRQLRSTVRTSDNDLARSYDALW